MFRIFETETFITSLEQDFEGQKDKIKAKLRNQVYKQLKESQSFGPNIKNYETGILQHEDTELILIDSFMRLIMKIELCL